MAFTNNDHQDSASPRNMHTSNSIPSSSTSAATSLLRTSPPVAMYGATTTPQRPLLPHAQTTSGARDTPTAPSQTSQPLLARATTTNAILRPTAQRTTSEHVARPSLFKRISSRIDKVLEISTEASYAHRNRPTQPSHWTDHAHRGALLETWDSVHEAAASSKSKYPSSVTGQLVAVERGLVLQFPELAQGEVVLGREWMAYVLGVSLRHPFCTEGKMGRWEVLSGAAKVGGMRAWGPW